MSNSLRHYQVRTSLADELVLEHEMDGQRRVVQAWDPGETVTLGTMIKVASEDSMRLKDRV